jgi:hypothetical protein
LSRYHDSIVTGRFKTVRPANRQRKLHFFARIIATLEKPSRAASDDPDGVKFPRLFSWRRAWLVVPDQILIGVFPKIRLYGFRRVEGRIPELLKVLEEGGATGLGGSPRAFGIIDIAPA